MDPLPLQMWTFRYWHPVYKRQVVLDCPATWVGAALESARRFIRRQNYAFRRAKVSRYIPVPTNVWQMRLEAATVKRNT